ncbi:MAG: NBR1-Ig-like domain-containing protein [Anaerolineae bacterium]
MRKIILALLSLAVIGALLSVAGPYQTANAEAEAARLLVEECTPDADFVADVTVPDDTIFQPGESFDKIWRLKNTGDCEWSEKYALTFIRGDQMDAPNSQPLEKAVAAGGTVNIGVKMVAPDKDGVYTGYWRMADAKGAPFGDEIYVRIVVKVPAPTPPPGETPAEPTTGWVKHQAEGFELSLPETWEVIPLEKEQLELMVKIMKETEPQLAGQIETLLSTGLYEQFRLFAMDTESVESITNLNVIYVPMHVTVRVYIASVKAESCL